MSNLKIDEIKKLLKPITMKIDSKYAILFKERGKKIYKPDRKFLSKTYF